MDINICETQYSIESKVDNLLAVLLSIKNTQNSSLAFRSGCRSGVCGSCAVVVNGVEKLACKTTIKDNDTVSALKNSKVLKDLVVDLSTQDRFLKEAQASLKEKSDLSIAIEDEKKIDIQTNCILCNSCFSSCPVYEVNPDFLGPFALTRVQRYVNDKKENKLKSKIDTIQTNGIWDCTLCGNCSMVCPQHIDIKNDIVQLRNKSAQFGYTDPNMDNFNSGFDTNLDFGFNPNGF
ncbi:MAG: 2Fe-2S iron-sulfur cluster-binding protein [Campylobacterota bacterium]|nr:2Fe-2S iron-sulfur cluster-binding protein [Campylobacterota bacterium]